MFAGLSSGSAPIEGNYSIYKILNEFDGLLGFAPTFSPDVVLISSAAIVGINQQGSAYFINPDGSMLQAPVSTVSDSGHADFIGSSLFGEYLAICDGSSNQVAIYKYGVLLQTLILPATIITVDTIAMSADGHYLVIHGTNAGNTNDYIIIYEGF